MSDISYPDPQLKTLIVAASANLSLGTEGSFSQPSHTFDIYDQGGITNQPLGDIIIIIIIIIITIINLMFTTKPALPTDRLGPFSLRRLVPLATFCRRDEDFAPFGNFGILAPADSANFPFYFKIPSDHSCGKIQMTEKKSIKNSQARIPKI